MYATGIELFIVITLNLFLIKLKCVKSTLKCYKPVFGDSQPLIYLAAREKRNTYSVLLSGGHLSDLGHHVFSDAHWCDALSTLSIRGNTTVNSRFAPVQFYFTFSKRKVPVIKYAAYTSLSGIFDDHVWQWSGVVGRGIRAQRTGRNYLFYHACNGNTNQSIS
jgi:hypothetical protein